MATVKFRNINPLGAVELPLIRRTLAAGEVFEVDESIAGAAATDDDPGYGLLGQVGTNYELVTDSTPVTPVDATVDAPTTQNEG